jgi:hypothetical protein
MQTVCGGTFGGKTTKSLLSNVCWSGRLSSCLSRLSLEMSPLDWSAADWGRIPLPPQLILWQLHYISRIFALTAHRKEAGRFWHCSKVDMKFPHLFCYKGFLLKPLVKEFAGKWLLWPESTLVTWLATSGPLGCVEECAFGPNPPVFDMNPHLGEGEKSLGCHLVPPPHIREFFFFASFSLIQLIAWHLPFLLDVNCSSWCSPSFWS